MNNLSTLNFDANTVAPSSFEALPIGDYVLVLTESEVKETAKRDGTYIKCKFEVIEGQYKGRMVFEQITLTNPNEEAVKIGRGTLSALCRAVGVMTPKDSAELHGRPLVATLGVEKRSDNGELKNRIKKYTPAGNVQGVVTGGSSKPSATPAATAPAAAPWAAK